MAFLKTATVGHRAGCGRERPTGVPGIGQRRPRRLGSRRYITIPACLRWSCDSRPKSLRDLSQADSLGHARIGAEVSAATHDGRHRPEKRLEAAISWRKRRRAGGGRRGRVRSVGGGTGVPGSRG